MGNSESDPGSWIKGLVSSVSRIRFAPGVIGKSSMLNACSAAVWILALWRCDSEHLLFDGLLLAAAALFTLYVRSENGKMRTFAVANPTLALMEGADITEHKKVELEAAKGLPNPGHSIATQDPLKLSILDENNKNGPN